LDTTVVTGLRVPPKAGRRPHRFDVLSPDGKIEAFAAASLIDFDYWINALEATTRPETPQSIPYEATPLPLVVAQLPLPSPADPGRCGSGGGGESGGLASRSTRSTARGDDHDENMRAAVEASLAVSSGVSEPVANSFYSPPVPRPGPGHTAARGDYSQTSRLMPPPLPGAPSSPSAAGRAVSQAGLPVRGEGFAERGGDAEERELALALAASLAGSARDVGQRSPPRPGIVGGGGGGGGRGGVEDDEAVAWALALSLSAEPPPELAPSCPGPAGVAGGAAGGAAGGEANSLLDLFDDISLPARAVGSHGDADGRAKGPEAPSAGPWAATPPVLVPAMVYSSSSSSSSSSSNNNASASASTTAATASPDAVWFRTGEDKNAAAPPPSSPVHPWTTSSGQSAALLQSMRAGAALRECPICLERLEEGRADDARRTCALPCFHLFHRSCALAWLEVTKECPVCNSAVELSPEDL